MLNTKLYIYIYLDGLAQDCINSSALAMELLQFCTSHQYQVQSFNSQHYFWILYHRSGLIFLNCWEDLQISWHIHKCQSHSLYLSLYQWWVWFSYCRRLSFMPITQVTFEYDMFLQLPWNHTTQKPKYNRDGKMLCHVSSQYEIISMA